MLLWQEKYSDYDLSLGSFKSDILDGTSFAL